MKPNRILGLLVVSACGALLLCLLLIGGQGGADERVHPTVTSLEKDQAGVGAGPSPRLPVADAWSAHESPAAAPVTTLRAPLVPFDEDAERDLGELVQRL